MDREKFQQKALKQAKQKKSKSAEFLMVEEDGEAIEGIGNPAFHMSSPDLSAQQPSEEKVIRHDRSDPTLAAHQQEFRLPASAALKGNECSRNYFDPLMDEEINPRRCGREVSREGDDGILYNRLMRLFDDSGQEESQESTEEEDLDTEDRMCPSERHQTEEATPDYIEEFERHARRETVLLASSPLEQDLKQEGERLNEDISMSCLKADKTFGNKAPSPPSTANLSVCKKGGTTELRPLPEAPSDSRGAAGSCCKAQPLQIRIQCVRRLKDKAPQGTYCLRVSLLGRLGSCVSQWWPAEQLKIGTRPVWHGGGFYDVGLYVHETLCVVLPGEDVQPGMAFLFELLLLHETCPGLGRVVGWAVFPLCDYNFSVVEGRFKCPLLRGRYDKEIGSFRKVEDLICLDLDHWLCNLYFQVIKLPSHLDDQKSHEIRAKQSPEFPTCPVAATEKARLGLDNAAGPGTREMEKNMWAWREEEAKSAGLSSQGQPLTPQTDPDTHAQVFPPLGRKRRRSLMPGKAGGGRAEKTWRTEPQDGLQTFPAGSISNNVDPCPTSCGLGLLKEDQEFHSEVESNLVFKAGFEVQDMLKQLASEKSTMPFLKREILTAHSVEEKSSVWRHGEREDYAQDVSYLEELEKHRFSVWSSSVAGSTRGAEFSKHLRFVQVSLTSELDLAQWQSQGFWYVTLLGAAVWFLRLYLHYLGQWLFLQLISTPVTRFHFHPHTVELCYLTSLLRIGEELAVVVLGPFVLSTVVFLLGLVRRGCQLLFSSCPDALSKLIITMGLWTVLDPLAVFIVDACLGRLTLHGDSPVADAAKLYWMFVRTKQPGILGVMITLLLYALLFIISSSTFYLYYLRVNSGSWMLDTLQRTHSEETKFFLPYDLEISNQELSYIVKRSEQWRGLHGERRKVAVCDYTGKSHGVGSSVSGCDLQHRSEKSVSALGPGDAISHVSIVTVYPSGFQELFRHFLRLPDGAIIEVFGEISALNFVPCEVIAAIEERLREMDTVQGDGVGVNSREMKRTH